MATTSKSPVIRSTIPGITSQRTYITLASSPASSLTLNGLSCGLKSLQISNPQIASNAFQPVRTVTKFSLQKGKRKSVKAVLNRFLRLQWGGWIRTRCGRHKKMHRKGANRKRRLRQHVLVNSQQAHLLDKMVTKFWLRPKHYIEDVYEPYHTRSYWMARKRPVPLTLKPPQKI